MKLKLSVGHEIRMGSINATLSIPESPFWAHVARNTIYHFMGPGLRRDQIFNVPIPDLPVDPHNMTWGNYKVETGGARLSFVQQAGQPVAVGITTADLTLSLVMNYKQMPLFVSPVNIKLKPVPVQDSGFQTAPMVMPNGCGSKVYTPSARYNFDLDFDLQKQIDAPIDALEQKRQFLAANLPTSPSDIKILMVHNIVIDVPESSKIYAIWETRLGRLANTAPKDSSLFLLDQTGTHLFPSEPAKTILSLKTLYNSGLGQGNIGGPLHNPVNGSAIVDATASNLTWTHSEKITGWFAASRNLNYGVEGFNQLTQTNED